MREAREWKELKKLKRNRGSNTEVLGEEADKKDGAGLEPVMVEEELPFSVTIGGQEKQVNFDDDEQILSAADMRRLYLGYSRLTKNYNSAIREVKTKLEILDDDFELLHRHNPIHHMESRIKSPESILEKLARKGKTLDLENIHTQLYDIAGIRVICHYIEDIYTIADLLRAQTDITVIRERDYIKDPKPNGYRSLHLVVQVPVFFVDGMEEIPVEVQIRTMAMDFWASLEHQLRYKSQGEIPKFIADELLECSEAITASDLKMQRIHSFLDDLENLENPNAALEAKEEAHPLKNISPKARARKTSEEAPEALETIKPFGAGIRRIRKEKERKAVKEKSSAVLRGSLASGQDHKDPAFELGNSMGLNVNTEEGLSS